MKAYVYDYVIGLTSNYHDGGAALVITDGDPIEALRAESPEADVSDATPVVFDTDATEPHVFIFPDSGCC